jgi:anaerobic ribonucleoside-triphosphate reductase activating protein
MNYATIKDYDIANGLGIRVSLFVSGCRNHCKGCFNKEAWDFNYGTPYTQETQQYILNFLSSSYIQGLSVLGGDPFEPENLPIITQLCKEAKMLYPNKDIWVYTGYLYEDIKHHEIFEYIDILVDGPFIEDLKDIRLKFRGSSNQRVINIKTNQLVEV